MMSLGNVSSKQTGGTVILDIFHEMQKAQSDWRGDHEQQIFDEAIEQAKLADQVGFDCWWTVEHHGATEFSYSSSPEMMVCALAQHTERLRFGHSGILALAEVNHPMRIAERAAFMDRLSGGRLELGLARSGGTEWDAFGVNPETSRDQLREAMHMIPRMWTENDFSWKSDLMEIPTKDVVPKPLQTPHPPLWQTCTSPDSFEMAGQMGVGALATTLLSPLSMLGELLDIHRNAIASCTQPAGHVVNDQRAVFTFMHVAESREAAIASRAAEQALWFVNAAPRVFQVPRSIWIDAIRGDFADNDPAATASVEVQQDRPGDDDLDDPVPVIRLLNRQKAGIELDPVEAYEVMEAEESVVIGDVNHCIAKARGFESIGVDRLMGLMAFGGLPQEHILSSIKLAGEHVLPALAKAPAHVA